MNLALQFEATCFAEIRRHHDSLAPSDNHDPRQLDLFRKYPLF
jgi:hypothetical protein